MTRTISRRLFMQGAAAGGIALRSSFLCTAVANTAQQVATVVAQSLSEQAAHTIAEAMMDSKLVSTTPDFSSLTKKKFPDVYKKFCRQSAALLTFDRGGKGGYDFNDVSSRDSVVKQMIELDRTCYCCKDEGKLKITFGAKIIEYNEPAVRAQHYQQLRKEYLDALALERSANTITEHEPHFYFNGYDFEFCQECGHDLYVRLDDPEFLREVKFFQEYGVWAGSYPQEGPNIKILQQIQNCYLSRYMTFRKTYSSPNPWQQKFQFGENDLSDLTVSTGVQAGLDRDFRKIIPLDAALHLNSAKDVTDFLGVPYRTLKDMDVRTVSDNTAPAVSRAPLANISPTPSPVVNAVVTGARYHLAAAIRDSISIVEELPLASVKDQPHDVSKRIPVSGSIPKLENLT